MMRRERRGRGGRPWRTRLGRKDNHQQVSHLELSYQTCGLSFYSRHRAIRRAASSLSAVCGPETHGAPDGAGHILTSTSGMGHRGSRRVPQVSGLRPTLSDVPGGRRGRRESVPLKRGSPCGHVWTETWTSS